MAHVTNGLKQRNDLEYSTNDRLNSRAATPENRSSGFPTRSDINRPVQLQKQARSLKFRI